MVMWFVPSLTGTLRSWINVERWPSEDVVDPWWEGADCLFIFNAGDTLIGLATGVSRPLFSSMAWIGGAEVFKVDCSAWDLLSFWERFFGPSTLVHSQSRGRLLGFKLFPRDLSHINGQQSCRMNCKMNLRLLCCPCFQLGRNTSTFCQCGTCTGTRWDSKPWGVHHEYDLWSYHTNDRPRHSVLV